MRVFLVDRDAAARRFLGEYVRRHQHGRLVGESQDTVEAVTQINTCKPDVVFAGVGSPELDGFQLLPHLTHQPMVVFSATSGEYAARAFEVRAVDYLLKPLDPRRLHHCLTRIGETLHTRERVQNLPETKPGLQKIVCFHCDRYEIVWLKDMLKLEKKERYTSVLTRGGRRFLSTLSLGYLADHIQDPRFLRVNRSLIVTQELLAGFTYGRHGTIDLDLSDGDRCTVSRRRAKAFKTWIQVA